MGFHESEADGEGVFGAARFAGNAEEIGALPIARKASRVTMTPNEKEPGVDERGAGESVGSCFKPVSGELGDERKS